MNDSAMSEQNKKAVCALMRDHKRIYLAFFLFLAICLLASAALWFTQNREVPSHDPPRRMAPQGTPRRTRTRAAPPIRIRSHPYRTVELDCQLARADDACSLHSMISMALLTV